MIIAFIIIIAMRNAAKRKNDKANKDVQNRNRYDYTGVTGYEPAAWQFRRNVDYREYNFFLTRNFDYRYWTD
jgi:hypothetical protein